MLSKKLTRELNEQVSFELESGYIYLGMSAWAETANLVGTAHFFKLQAKEEVAHAMKLFGYLVERGAKVELGALARPKNEYAGFRAVLEAALKHERIVTGRIHKLVELARAEKDHATVNLLNWYVDEQVEEEANFEAILGRISIAGDRGAALLFLDKELGKRADG